MNIADSVLDDIRADAEAHVAALGIMRWEYATATVALVDGYRALQAKCVEAANALEKPIRVFAVPCDQPPRILALARELRKAGTP